MKYILCNTCFLFFIVSSYCQYRGATFQASAGTSTQKNINLSIGFGYEYRNLIAEGIILAPLDHKASHAAYLQAIAGYQINYGVITFTPLLIAAYRLKSTDKSGLNGMVAGAGLRAQYRDVFLSCNYMDKIVFLGVGIRGKLSREE